MGRDIVGSFLSIFGSNLGKLMLGVAGTPVVTRVLGSSGYGDYAVVLSVLGVTMIFVNAGLFDGIRKYIAEDRDLPDWKASVFVFYLRVATVVVATATVLLLAASYTGVAAAAFGPEYGTYLRILVAIVVVEQLWKVTRGTLMGLGYERYTETTRVVNELLVLVVGVPLAYVGFGVTGMLVGQFVGGLVATGALVAVIYRVVDPDSLTRTLPDEFPRRELLSFNGQSVLVLALLTSLYHADLLLLGTFAGGTVAGYYKAALVVAEFTWFVPSALQMVLLHSTSELWSDERDEYVSELASRITRYTLLFTLLLATGLAALAETFVPVYFGDEFRPAVTPLLVLLPGTVGFAVSRPILAITQGKGELRVLVYATGAASVVNLALNLALIPRYGIAGAAAATSVGYGSMFLLLVVTARHVGFYPLRDARWSRVVTTAVASGAVIVALAAVIDSAVLSLTVVPPVGFAVYLGFAVGTGAIDAGEVRELLEYLPVGRDALPRVD